MNNDPDIQVVVGNPDAFDGEHTRAMRVLKSKDGRVIGVSTIADDGTESFAIFGNADDIKHALGDV